VHAVYRHDDRALLVMYSITSMLSVALQALTTGYAIGTIVTTWGAAHGVVYKRNLRKRAWMLSRRLKVSNVLGSLIAVGDSFRMVGAEKLKESLLKLVEQEGVADCMYIGLLYFWQPFD